MKRLGVILAGGRATRMGGKIKCLLSLEEGHTILDNIILGLYMSGCNKIEVITGSNNREVKKFIHNRCYDPNIVYTKYAGKGKKTNNMYSLMKSSISKANEVIWVNGDVVISPMAIVRLSETSGIHKCLVDCSSSIENEVMKTYTLGKNKFIFSKEVLEYPILGEFCGITFLRGKEIPKYINYCKRYIKNVSKNGWFEESMNNLSWSIEYVKPDEYFIEIDTPDDLKKGRKLYAKRNTLSI